MSDSGDVEGPGKIMEAKEEIQSVLDSSSNHAKEYTAIDRLDYCYCFKFRD